MDWLIKLLGGYTNSEVESVKEKERKITKQFQIIADQIPENEPLVAMQYLYEVIKESRCDEIVSAFSSVFQEIQSHIQKSNGCSNAVDLLKHFNAGLLEANKSDDEKRLSHYNENVGIINNALNFIGEFNKQLIEPISALDLSTRAFNALDRRGISIIGEIAVLAEDQIRQVNSLGDKSFNEIASAMEKLGFPLGCELPTTIKNAVNMYSNAKAGE